MIRLWQTEWCPASRRVRQRLTELGVEYLVRQVPAERASRTALRTETGDDTIPALTLAGGPAVVGEKAILAWLDARFEESPEAEAHRVKAAKARRLTLEEECECPPSPTP